MLWRGSFRSRGIWLAFLPPKGFHLNQSTLIGGALLAAFVLFITSRDRLSSYGRILWGEKPEAHAPGAAAADKNSAANTIAGATLGGWAQDLGATMDQFGIDMDEWAKGH